MTFDEYTTHDPRRQPMRRPMADLIAELAELHQQTGLIRQLPDDEPGYFDEVAY